MQARARRDQTAAATRPAWESALTAVPAERRRLQADTSNRKWSQMSALPVSSCTAATPPDLYRRSQTPGGAGNLPFKEQQLL